MWLCFWILIVLSVFQTDWFLGGHREGGGTGRRDGGSRRLSANTSSVERQGIPRLLQPDLWWCAPGYLVPGTTSCLLTGEGLEMERGEKGHWGVVSDMCFISVVLVESVNPRG